MFFVPAAAIFVLVGILGPGIGRTLNTISIKRIGVSRTIPIGGIAPFFATLLAIAFLGEEYSIYLFLGMAFIIFGIFILSRRKENGKRVFDKKDLFIPLIAAAFGGSSIAISKFGLAKLDDPAGYRASNKHRSPTGSGFAEICPAAPCRHCEAMFSRVPQSTV